MNSDLKPHTRQFRYAITSLDGGQGQKRTSLGPKPAPLTDAHGNPLKIEHDVKLGVVKPAEGEYVTSKTGTMKVSDYKRNMRWLAQQQSRPQVESESVEDWLKRHKIGANANGAS